MFQWSRRRVRVGAVKSMRLYGGRSSARCQLPERGLQDVRELRHLLVAEAVEIRALALRINRQLKRRARRIRAEDGEAVVFVHEPRAASRISSRQMSSKIERFFLFVKLRAPRRSFCSSGGGTTAMRDELADGCAHVAPAASPTFFTMKKERIRVIAHQVEHAELPGVDDLADLGQRELLQARPVPASR